MHILHLTTKLEFSGTEISIHNLTKFHPNKSARITVCALTAKVPYKGRLEADGIRVIYLKMLANNFWQVCYNSPLYLWKLFRLFRKEKVTVLHIHSFLAGILGRISGFLARIPVIIRHLHNMELDLPSRIYVERLLRYLTHHYIASSEGVSEYAKRNAGIRKEVISVVYYGIDIAAIEQAAQQSVERRREFGLKEDEVVIGFCGRLVVQKGVIFLLRAMPLILKEIPSVKLLIIGDGPLRKELMDTAISLNIQDNVIFIGERRDTWSIFPILELFVLPSLWEGLGIVLLESMVHAKPIIATNIPSVNEVIEDGRTGLLVPPRDPEALAKAIMRLLKDPKLRSNLAQNSREKVVRRYASERMVEEVNRIYSDLLKT